MQAEKTAFTIRQRILASFALILGLMLAMGAVGYQGLKQIQGFADQIAGHSLPGLHYSHQITLLRVENYAVTQELVLQKDPVIKHQLRASIGSMRNRMDNLIRRYERQAPDQHDAALIARYVSTIRSYREAQDALFAAAFDPRSTPEAIAGLDETVTVEHDKTRQAAEAMLTHHGEQTDALVSSIKTTIAGAETLALVMLAIAVPLAFICGFFLNRAIGRPLARLAGILDVIRTGDLSRRLVTERADEFGIVAAGFNRSIEELAALVGQVQQSGIQVNSSVMEIAATARQQQATASEIAATTSEIGATSREISLTSKKLVATMNEVAAVADQSAELATRGQDGLTHMEATMRRVMDAAGTVNAKLAILNDRAGSISQVVTTISKVADQTNLLSLNAAIEAEKAGEYGRGFSVVATEIRRLADQTAVATYDIEQTVKEIQAAVAAGVMGMDKFSEEVRRGVQDVQQVGGQLSQVIHDVQALAPRVESVNEGVQAQALGAEQITGALAQLSEAAQQTVDSLRQSGQAIDELNMVAVALRSGVSRFTLQAA